MRRYCHALNHQRGVALIIVLWMSVLLTAVASGFAYLTRIESIVTRRAVDDVLSVEAARAGLELAIYQLQHPESKQRPWADGRPYKILFEKMELTIRIQDESGKIAINGATQKQWETLFLSVGVEQEKALTLADATLDFSDYDNLVRIHGAEADDYAAAGLMHAPKNAPFTVLEELLQVYGMDYAIYQRIVPALTSYGTKSQPDWRLAPEAILRTVPDMTDEFIDNYLQLRFEQTSPVELLPALPDGRQLTVYAGSGPIYAITIEVMLPSKVVRRMQAVVNVNKNNGHVPYELLEWQELHW